MASSGLASLIPIVGTIIGSMYGMPWLGAAASGLGTWAATGDIGRGIGSGLLSYGLGSAASSLMGAGDAANVAAQQAATDVARQTAAASAFPDMALGAADFADTPFMQAAPLSRMDAFTSGIQQPGALKNAFMGPGTLMSTTGPIAGGLSMMGGAGQGTSAAPPQQKTYGIPTLANPYQRQVQFPGQVDPYGREHRYFAEGGGVHGGRRPQRPDWGDSKRLEANATVDLSPGSMTPERYGVQLDSRTAKEYLERGTLRSRPIKPEAHDFARELEDSFNKAPRKYMAKGGLASLKPARMVKGDGDGLSDSIPASINGSQPASLSDSEFVVPSDVVGHLGNGSTDAGAKRLYDMMHRVRKARTGKGSAPKAINPMKVLPA